MRELWKTILFPPSPPLLWTLFPATAISSKKFPSRGFPLNFSSPRFYRAEVYFRKRSIGPTGSVHSGRQSGSCHVWDSMEDRDELLSATPSFSGSPTSGTDSTPSEVARYRKYKDGGCLTDFYSTVSDAKNVGECMWISAFISLMKLAAPRNIKYGTSR